MEKQQTTYSPEIREEALSLRYKGKKYHVISEELGIPENTLRKWFAPSVNRHNLAEITEEHLKECIDQSRKILMANIANITDKLVENALDGDMKAITEALDRVHGKPGSLGPVQTHRKRVTGFQYVSPEESKDIQVTFVDAKEEIERLEKLKSE
ncbi:MAG: hypothetical protein WD000_00325 [Thermodesulfobacteriota bacterium]